MAATTNTTLNENIKKKLLALSENVRRNLLLASGNIQRKFVLEERDFLSILILAIQHLNKPQQPLSTTTNKQQETNETNHLKQTNTLKENNEEKDGEKDDMGKSGGKTENNSREPDSSEKLRKELIRIVDSTSFDSDSKSWLILDMYNRYQKETALTKEREILNAHLKSHPNVLVGGGGVEKEDENASPEDQSHTPKIGNSEQPSSSTTAPPPEREPPQGVTRSSLSEPVNIWINDAIKIITSYMKKKVNVIFLDNLQYHANKLRTFLVTKGAFDKDNNRVHTPHNRFFLKKASLYFKIKSAQQLQIFDLATLLACISFSKSKLFRFLQYRFKKVKAFSKNEKQCLHIFLNTCPISKKRIPCKSIRDLANP